MTRQRQRGAFAACAGAIYAGALALGAVRPFGSMAPAAAQEAAAKPNILFIMGDDIGLDAAGHLSPRSDGRGDAEH